MIVSWVKIEYPTNRPKSKKDLAKIQSMYLLYVKHERVAIVRYYLAKIQTMCYFIPYST